MRLNVAPNQAPVARAPLLLVNECRVAAYASGRGTALLGGFSDTLQADEGIASGTINPNMKRIDVATR